MEGNIPDRQTILIVDDEIINLAILSKLLSSKYRVLAAKSGEQALKIQAEETIDLILLDIMLPEMDGYAVLRHLKNGDRSKNIPVIFITAKSADQDEARGLQLGAVDYIRKPFYLPIVQARVETHLELKLKNDILTDLVCLDGLTNIFNRRKFDETLDKEWRRACRTRTPLSLLIIDVDHFKPFNDNYGHAAGDGCLRRIAAALQSALKRAGDLLARYGGEEFTILLPYTDVDGGRHMAADARARVADLRIPHAFSLTADHVTVSVGGATAIPGEQCSTPQLLLDSADQMLYQAKTAGRDCYRLHAFPAADSGRISAGTPAMAGGPNRMLFP